MPEIPPPAPDKLGGSGYPPTRKDFEETAEQIRNSHGSNGPQELYMPKPTWWAKTKKAIVSWKGWPIVKIVLIVVAAILTFRFVRDFFSVTEEIKVTFIDFKQRKWRKDPDDKKKPTVKDPLTDKEIDDELKKLNSGG